MCRCKASSLSDKVISWPQLLESCSTDSGASCSSVHLHLEVCTVYLDCYLDWLRLAALIFQRKYSVGGVGPTFLLSLQNVLQTRLPVHTGLSLWTFFRFLPWYSKPWQDVSFCENNGVCSVLAPAAIAVMPVLSALLLLHSVHWCNGCMQLL